MRNSSKKKIKEAVIIIAVIFTAATSLSYLLVKGYLSFFILTNIKKVVEKKTGGDLSIGSVDISLFPTVLTVKKIRFNLNNHRELSLKIEEASTGLDLFRIISGNIAMNNVKITGPGLQLETEPSALSELMEPKKKKKKISSYFFRPSVEDLNLTDGNIGVALGKKLSFEIGNLNTRVKKLSRGKYLFEITATSGEISYKRKRKNLSNIKIFGALGKSSFEIRELALNLDEDKMSGNALFSFDKKSKILGHITAKAPLDIAGLFLEKQLYAAGGAEMESYFTYNKGAFKLSSELIIQKGSVSGIPIEGLNAEISYKQGIMDIKKVTLKAMNGSSSLNGRIDYNNKNFGFKYIFNNMNISSFIAGHGVKPASGISGSLSGDGGLQPLSFKGTVKAESEGFLAIDGSRKTSPLLLGSEIQLGGKDITISDGYISSRELAASFYGKVKSLKHLDMSVNLESRDLSWLSFLFGQSFAGSAEIKGKVSGSFLKPEFSGYADIKNPAFKEFSAKRVNGNITYSKGVIETDTISVSGKESLFNIGGKIFLKTDAPNFNISISIPYADLSDIADMTGKAYSAKGKIRGSVKIKDTISSPHVRADLNMEKGELFNETFDQLHAKGSYKHHRFKLDRVRLSKNGGTVITDGTFDLKKPFGLNLSIKRVQLEEINYLKKHFSLRGLADGKVKVSGTLIKPVIEADATLLNGYIFGEETDKLRISGSYKNGSVKVKHFDATRGEGTVVVDERQNQKGDKFLAINIRNYDVAENAYLKEKAPDLTSKLDMNAALFSDINLHALDKSFAKLAVGKMSISTKKNKYRSIRPFELSYADSAFQVKNFSIDSVNGSISLDGTIDSAGLINADIIGAVEVSGLAEYLKGITKIGGALTFDADLGGTIKKPTVRALLTARNGMVRFKGFPYDISKINSLLNLTPEALNVETVEGIFQKQPFYGGGYLTFNNFRPDRLNLFFEIGEVRLRYPDWLSSTGRGRITVTGKGRDITLGGEIDVLRASYTEDINLNEMIKKAISKNISVEKEKEKKHGLKFNLNFKADDNIVVKNNLADIELKGYLTLTGKTPRPSLIGELETLRGKIIFRNDQFTITKGTVSFRNPEKITPYFEVDAYTDVKGYHIYLDVNGTPQLYEVHLSSDPPLEEKEIVSILSFGYTGSELRGKDTQITSLGTAALLLQDEIETKVKKYFGFDRFRIDPYYSESTGSTEARVSVSKELSEDVTATYSRGISNIQQDEMYLSYSLSDNITFLGSWSSRKEGAGAFGGDVILRYEFQ